VIDLLFFTEKTPDAQYFKCFLKKFQPKRLQVSKKALPLQSLLKKYFQHASGEVGEWLKPAVC